MKAEQIHAVTNAVGHVLGRAAGMKTNLVRISWSDGLQGVPPFSVVVGLDGTMEPLGLVSGALCLLMERSVARRVAEKMAGDPSFAQAEDPEVLPVISELLNMIAGNAIGVLRATGAALSISPPAYLDAKVDYFKGVRVALVQMDCEAGRYHVAMFLRET
jgi:CheY-specific phosphatase CheX